MATRQTHLRKVFENADGSVSRSADKDFKTFRVELFNAAKDANGNFIVADTIDFDVTALSADMQKAAMGYGISQKLGDGVAGIVKLAEKVGFTPDAVTGYAKLIRTELESMWEDILNGFWTEERESSEGSGGSVTIVFQAVQAAFAKAGILLSDTQIVGIKDKLATKDGLEAFKSRPDVKAEMAQIKAERAAAAAKAAAEAAAKVEAVAGSDLASLL